ncbi:hypothetical protein KC332_g1136 [Hortaea werneckii]|uniref:Uncharacterized protein n=1 Tax=Hortaea werneckii TaxID=91943 RepID=A0A3M7I7R8_HORWE|nr:hypothetical protein KC358_g4288 [Hortaea werneckii]KAI6846124.1 hypothetical protein KC350_g4070 [Hortaea werneckii]KAI6930103.1 hypothetical protein KC341_g10448 [Hortaea werneckii]KAI6949775.1 hypothetical protein KC348_g1098 [Hortaea werneckii]KAI6974689.1 hypothetical protein KC321_g4962 [Hortaea werneckii]
MAKKKSKAQRNTAALAHFNMNYGVDETKLQGWQRLCEDVGIAPEDSIKQCKKALKTTFVNIHDLVAAKQQGKTPQRFPTRKALRDYIVATNKWFSKEVAKQNGFLRVLLIEVWG